MQAKIKFYDELLKNMLLAEENLRLKEEDLKEDTEAVTIQEAEIKKLDELLAKE